MHNTYACVIYLCKEKTCYTVVCLYNQSSVNNFCNLNNFFFFFLEKPQIKEMLIIKISKFGYLLYSYRLLLRFVDRLV